MTLRVFDPIQTIPSMRDSIDRMFREVMDTQLPSLTFLTLQPAPIDIYEEEQGLVVKASLPGFKADDIAVSVDGLVLSITAGTEQEHKEQSEDKKYHLHERRSGRVERVVTLPFAVRTEEAEAQFQDGTLTLHLPRIPNTEARRIPVKG